MRRRYRVDVPALFGLEELAALIASAQSDSASEAWPKLIKTYTVHAEQQLDDVLARAMGGLPILDQEERGDIITDALFRAIRTYDPNRGAKFNTHLCWQLIGYTTKLVKRRRAAKRCHDIASIEPLLDFLPTDGPRMVLDPDVAAKVCEAVENLEHSSVEHLRLEGVVLRRFFWEGAMKCQIAHDEGVSKYTVRRSCARALVRLRKTFELYS